MTRAQARVRRIVARVAAFGLAAMSLALDLVHRGSMYRTMLHTDLAAVIITWSFSIVLWTSATVASTRRRPLTRWIARAVLAVLGAITMLQAAAFFYFATTIDFQLLRSAWQLEGMESAARPFLGTIARWMAAGAIVAVAWSILVGRIARARRTTARRAVIAMGATLVVALASSSYLPHSSGDAAPDMLALGAVGRFGLERPKHAGTAAWSALPEMEFPRTVPPVPHVDAHGRRNVLFVLTESVRASAVCSAYGDDCAHNPFSNEALPHRLPLERMRAVDTATLLSFGVMFMGLAVDAPKTDWLTAPLLFDYAHAAGIATAYISAQHPAFAGSHAWTDGEPLDRLAWGTDFDAHADKMLGADDGDVTDRMIAELPHLHEPFFAVLHFSGTHFPYRIDSDSPFRPIGVTLDRRDPTPMRNRYFDSIYRQDKFTTNVVKAVRAMPIGKRTVIVYVSDHGESFYEHESGLHGSSLWDHELRVPAWIDAPPGVLSSEEVASLVAERDVPTTQEDIVPTILDLLGIYGVPQWAEFTRRMVGESLLRRPAAKRTMALATCNELWPCFVPLTGKLIGDVKWVTRPPSAGQCFDTRADPDEQHDLGPAACGQ
jgi:glucan phosphoethanolaminetransferase (alkaline phosphatase superfamily)